MGPLPGDEKRCDLDVVIGEEVDCDTYVRRLISYQSEPDSRTPAYLLIPKKALKDGISCPAVLCPHPTHAQDGFKTVVGLSDKPNRAYASELAERGFVTLAPSYPLLANYQPDWRALGYESGSMKAIWDNMRVLDVLETLPFVAPGKVGSIGHSLGGHNSIYTAVFESRIGVVVSSCGLDSYVDYKDGDLTGWTSDRYMPKLKDYVNRQQDIPFDFHDLVAALAPRPCLIAAPYDDSNFKWQSVDVIAQAAKRVYTLYGVDTLLTVEHPNCDHDFPQDVRAQAYGLFEKLLGVSV
ncbi:MAG: prolyl oligopeptidase family serine peptidase [Candidatus Latescibacteria bacterium]|nr:prolyl oligopeptidase family serine peptidase [Candidatus Latescibacterota bacterium]MBT4139239.1 prolyl oligopeptidase family serine peptidase [Candidatus Latescibacterota bacterium]